MTEFEDFAIIIADEPTGNLEYVAVKRWQNNKRKKIVTFGEEKQQVPHCGAAIKVSNEVCSACKKPLETDEFFSA